MIDPFALGEAGRVARRSEAEAAGGGRRRDRAGDRGRGARLLSEQERRTYRVVVSPAAERNLKAIGRRDRETYERVMAIIRALIHAPRPPEVRKLSGRESYRVRVGNYRVIYLVDDEEPVVTIPGVGHRRDIYDR